MSFKSKICTALCGVAVAGLFAASLPSPDAQADFTSLALKNTCKKGLSKGKTPVSLVVGAKPGCYDPKLAALGKKLLTGKSTTCFACHAVGGIAPYTTMNSNLRTQGYTLAPAQILAAFNVHLPEMTGATLSAKDAKNLNAFFQSIK